MLSSLLCTSSLAADSPSTGVQDVGEPEPPSAIRPQAGSAEPPDPGESDPAGGEEPSPPEPSDSGQDQPGSAVPGATLPGPGTVVRARRPYSAASSEVVRAEDLASRPIGDPSDLLEVTPGLITVQHAGGGKANQYFLRGFDLDHGTDLALSVDGLPVNMVSHGHGQGYADLHFVIPELVERLVVHKGPYLAELGDFATAGAVQLQTRSRVEETTLEASWGSFDTWRALAIQPFNWVGLSSYLAAELYGTDGPFENPEQTRRLNLLGRASLCLGGFRWGVMLQSYQGDWHASGQLPLRAVEAGTLSRFGSIDPTEGGGSSRHSLKLEATHPDLLGGRVALNAFALKYQLQMFSNFTFFALDPVNGDQIEQLDDRAVFGLGASYRRSLRLASTEHELGAGAELRHDSISTGLHHSTGRIRRDPVVSARTRETAGSLWLQDEVSFTSWLRAVLGVRADLFSFRVKDRLPGGSGSGTALAALLSPRLSMVATALAPLDLYLNLGRGFHSNDARGVVRQDQPVTPLTPALGYELGARLRWAGLDLAAAAWGLDLDSEIVWVGDEGTTEARGASRRWGLEAEARYRFTPWLRADLDGTWTRAQFTDGQWVPLAPTWTLAGGLRAAHPGGLFGSVRFAAIGDRPADEAAAFTAQGFWLVDAQLGYSAPGWRITLEGRNLLDTSWRQAQFVHSSRLPGEPAPVEDLHLTAGSPRSVQVSFAVMR